MISLSISLSLVSQFVISTNWSNWIFSLSSSHLNQSHELQINHSIEMNSFQLFFRSQFKISWRYSLKFDYLSSTIQEMDKFSIINNTIFVCICLCNHFINFFLSEWFT
jgi:hypothetical protein